jgi:hypothetical protein
MEIKCFCILLQKQRMGTNPFPFLIILFISCSNAVPSNEIAENNRNQLKQNTTALKKFNESSWQYFLQHLPVVDSAILDYKGREISYQQKAVGIIPYDVGKADLQQCADALMRLRAEYLFAQQKIDAIGFHFTGGQYYSFHDYCNGKKVVPAGNDIKFTNSNAEEKNHASLRKYLDIVYTYASTISLAKELKITDDFEVGTVVIHPGSPGHCFIIIDEAMNGAGEKLFKLAEGYTPAQSIYVLRNIWEDEKTAWHKLKEGTIETASYTFSNYQLKKFE